MEKLKILLKNISVSALSLLLLCVFLEISTKIYIEHFAGEKAFLKYASMQQLQKRFPLPKFSPHRYLGYYPTPNYKNGKNKHNSLGYRGNEIILPKPKNEFRIVCLGGSTTYSGVGDYRFSYPSLLEKELTERGCDNISVINAGCNGWSSWESLVNFQFRVLDLEPDMIIVYHGRNDIKPRFVWPPTAYKGDNSGALTPFVSQLFMPSVLEYSNLIRVLMIRAGLTKAHSSLEGSLLVDSNTNFRKLFREQVKEKSYPKGIFKKVSAEQMLETNKPIYFKRNIENIIAIAKQRNIKTILATFAFSRYFKHPKVASKEYILAYEETNSALRVIAKEAGVSLFDFAGFFPKDKQYYTDGIHVNIDGSRLKAKLFAQYIIGNNLIPIVNGLDNAE